MDDARRTEVLIVGSGGNAISVAAAFVEAGRDFTIITTHSDFGGVWHQNTYPGAGVDSDVINYQLRCSRSQNWTRMYPKQPELKAYFQRVATEFGLYENTDFETEMLAAEWLEDEAAWSVTTTEATYVTPILILSTGFLDKAVTPEIPGMDTFTGRIFHASMWPEGYTGEGDRIAIVGTGSSGAQIVPELQKVSAALTVFQSRAMWVIPYHDRMITDDDRASWALSPELYDQLCQELYEKEETEWEDVFLARKPGGYEEREQLALAFLQEQVPDPELRRLLTPDTKFGCTRPVVISPNNSYYRAVQQDNVELVPERAGRIGPTSIASASGREFDVDTIVLATGFTWGDHLLHHIKRRDGRTVGEVQAGRPRAYKSISVAGCPNLFLVGGPAPNGAIWDGLKCGGIAAPYILDAIRHMEETGIRALEVDEAAEIEWKRGADEILRKGPRSRAAGGCVNYFQDEYGDNKAMWPGTMAHMEQALSRFDHEAYHVVVPQADAIGEHSA